MRQVSLRSALRARAMDPALLGASHARRAPPGQPFAAGSGGSARLPPPVLERQAVPGGGDFWGDEKRRAGVGARSALRKLTRRICPSAASAANAASYAARPRTEHRSGVGAQRRPPQHEPPPGTACRDARNVACPPTAARAETRNLPRGDTTDRVKAIPCLGTSSLSPGGGSVRQRGGTPLHRRRQARPGCAGRPSAAPHNRRGRCA